MIRSLAVTVTLKISKPVFVRTTLRLEIMHYHLRFDRKRLSGSEDVICIPTNRQTKDFNISPLTQPPPPPKSLGGVGVGGNYPVSFTLLPQSLG